MLNLNNLFNQFNISANGIIQIGAHRGQELGEFMTLSSVPNRILLIEAAPHLIKHLMEISEKYEYIKVAGYAITNYNGKAKFNMLSNDMSSSLLPLKKHSELYPHIVKTHEIEVPCMRLDDLLKKMDEEPCNYNFLSMDVQGAEGLVFEGASTLLKYIEGIVVEVNHIEMYEGCILEPELTKFLRGKGFEKVSEARGDASFHYPTWGDVFYVKKEKI